MITVGSNVHITVNYILMESFLTTLRENKSSVMSMVKGNLFTGTRSCENNHILFITSEISLNMNRRKVCGGYFGLCFLFLYIYYSLEM